MPHYVGSSGVARKVIKNYIGVNGVARLIKRSYVGVGGVAREYFSAGIPFSYPVAGSNRGTFTYGKNNNGFTLSLTHNEDYSANYVVAIQSVDKLSAGNHTISFDLVFTGSYGEGGYNILRSYDGQLLDGAQPGTVADSNFASWTPGTKTVNASFNLAQDALIQMHFDAKDGRTFNFTMTNVYIDGQPVIFTF